MTQEGGTMFRDAMPVDWIEPGDSAVLDVEGTEVAVARVGDDFYAFQSLCPHQGTPLGGRPLDGDHYITCGQHHSRYDVRTGTCVRPADLDGFAMSLVTYPTRIVDDVVQVEL